MDVANPGNGKLKLAADSWYGWQMIPGYSGRNLPFFSPIRIDEITPRKTGRGILGLRFRNVLYAAGVQEFAIDLQIIRHQPNYLVAVPRGNGQQGRTGIISHIEFEWIERFCPDLWADHPPERYSGAAQNSVTWYLREVFER